MDIIYWSTLVLILLSGIFILNGSINVRKFLPLGLLTLFLLVQLHRIFLPERQSIFHEDFSLMLISIFVFYICIQHSSHSYLILLTFTTFLIIPSNTLPIVFMILSILIIYGIEQSSILITYNQKQPVRLIQHTFIAWLLLYLHGFFGFEFIETGVLISDCLAFFILFIFIAFPPQKEIEQGELPQANQDVLEFLSTNLRSKYKSTSLNQDEVEDLNHYINELLNEQQLFINPKFSLNMLSAKTGYTNHKLSQYFNTHLKTSFNDYVNQLRVNLFKDKINSNLNDQFTLLALAFDSGFQSKSSFNHIFKKIEGMTPKEYSKHIHVQNN